MDLQALIEALKGPNAGLFIDKASKQLAPQLAPPTQPLSETMAQFNPGARMLAANQPGPQMPAVPAAQNPAINPQSMSPMGANATMPEQAAQQAIQASGAQQGGTDPQALLMQAMIAQSMMGQNAQAPQQPPFPSAKIPPGGPQNPATIASLYAGLQPTGVGQYLTGR